MIICVCKSLMTSEVIEHIECNNTLEELVNETGAGTHCGCCKDYLADFFNDSKEPNSL